jgi:hypothetical protein
MAANRCARTSTQSQCDERVRSSHSDPASGRPLKGKLAEHNGGLWPASDINARAARRRDYPAQQQDQRSAPQIKQGAVASSVWNPAQKQSLGVFCSAEFLLPRNP